jgi:hypothetical protein
MNIRFDLTIHDDFDKVSNLIQYPTDYFDFPSSLLSFAQSIHSSNLSIIEGCFFRKLNNNMTLITYNCSGKELKEVLDKLALKRLKIKSLNFANKDFEGLKIKPYMDEFWVDQTYDLQKALKHMSSKHRSNRLREIKKGHSNYFCGNNVDIIEIDNLFKEWVIGASKRHFMVVKGHYLSYIRRYFENKRNIVFIPFRQISDNLLFGIAGFEVFHNKAQITLMKHRFGDSSFPTFFWSETISQILKLGVEKVFCGTTADDLKNYLGFNKQKSYKIIC